MTSISGLGSTYAGSYLPPSQPRVSADPMAAVAEKLGLSSRELKSQLQDGKSLEDVATDQGVARDELLSAIKAGMSGGGDAAAERIATSKGVPPPPPGGGLRGENAGLQDADKLSGIGRLLDLDDEQVITQATSPADLISMLQNKGVDLGQLRNVLNSGDLLDVRA